MSFERRGAAGALQTLCEGVVPQGAAGALQALGEALVPQGAAGALQALAADDGPGGRAVSALMTMSAGVLTASGVHPIAKLVFIGIVITYVLW